MMKLFAVLLPAFLCAVPASAGTDKSLLAARKTILSSASTPQKALIEYSAASKKSAAAPVMAEYGYALAYAGLGEAALYQLDRALITEPMNPESRFYLGEVLNACGLEDAASEESAPVPAWLGKPLKLPALELHLPEGDFDKASSDIDALMRQKRYVESAVLYDRLCKKYSSEARCHAGYAISLEKMGAYRAAAAEAKKDLALTQAEGHVEVAQAYITDMESRAPLKFTPEKVTLKGRYLAYLGGNITRSDGNSTTSVNARLGRFISERVDVSLNAGFSGGNVYEDYNGLTLGVSGRYNEPLNFLPLNWTMSCKLERVPAPDSNTTVLVSPGLSYFTPSGSLDMYLDFALAGSFKGSRTLSLGYTIYFGGGK